MLVFEAANIQTFPRVSIFSRHKFLSIHGIAIGEKLRVVGGGRWVLFVHILLSLLFHERVG